MTYNCLRYKTQTPYKQYILLYIKHSACVHITALIHHILLCTAAHTI